MQAQNRLSGQIWPLCCHSREQEPGLSFESCSVEPKEEPTKGLLGPMSGCPRSCAWGRQLKGGSSCLSKDPQRGSLGHGSPKSEPFLEKETKKQGRKEGQGREVGKEGGK